jgi:hypothetical protein
MASGLGPRLPQAQRLLTRRIQLSSAVPDEEHQQAT